MIAGLKGKMHLTSQFISNIIVNIIFISRSFPYAF
jgi:hypothetical protein